MATADGRIHRLGKDGGYGRRIILRHGGQYSTLYAHLTRYRKGLKSGATVRQGDVIGYVGSTGMATGPHLHYEFRVNGSHVNPLKFQPPRAQPIDKRYRQQFLAEARIWRTRLDALAGQQPAAPTRVTRSAPASQSG